jgi:PAS domain S-box-containing protein
MLKPVPHPAPPWVRAAIFGGAYFACAMISRTLTTTLNFEASYWLPSGLFLAGLLISDRKHWPILIGATFIASFGFNYQGSRWPFHLWLLAHAGNCVTALVGALLVQRFGARRPNLGSVQELIALFLFGALLSNLISATAGTFALKAQDLRTPFWDIWRPWLLSNVLGVVLLTPAIIAWQGAGRWQRFRSHPRRMEAVLIVAGMGSAMMLNYTFRGPWLQTIISQYLPIPFVIWAAIRLGTRGVTLASLVVATLTGWFSIWDQGYVSTSVGGPQLSTAQVQLNLAALSFFGLFPAIAISAHRRASEALQASEARFNRALRGAGDGLWEWNIITGSSYYSPRWKEMLGFTEPELADDRDESFVSRIHSDDLGRVQRSLHAHLEHGVPYDVECRLLTKSKQYRWFRSRGQAERNAAGQPIRVAGTLQDVTDRVEAEESLRESRRALSTLMSNLPGMAYRRTNDANGTLEFASEGARELTGYAPEELLRPAGIRYPQLIHPEDLPGVLSEITAGTRERRHYRLSYRILAAGGVEKWVWEQGTGVEGADGQIVATEGFIIDITERIRLEQQVIRAQRRESIGTLAAGVAHNLNNMLVPIVMGAELLRIPAGTKENERVLENIESSAKRASDLVKQLLAFGRGLEVARAKIVFADLIREVESIVVSTFPKNIVFQTQVHGDLWSVMGDATQLHQVLLNLCLNARDAITDGGCITLAARNEAVLPADASSHRGLAPGHYLCIEVSDTGCGMTKEVAERIFEPFFTTKEVNKGTGLGLSTVHGIVRTHGGTINVVSRPGEGSRFTIHLPVQPDAIALTAGSLPEQPPTGSGELVLVIDDEAIVLSVSRRSLESAGFKVITAETGEAALELYAKYRATIAVVVADSMMPGMDGPAVVQALRKFNPAVKIIATRGLPQPAGAPQLQVHHTLEKTADSAELIAAVKRVLRPAAALG